MNGRVEVITGPERRRRWSDEEKLQLVAEACQPGSSVSQVARERGISASQLFGWRRQMLAKGLVTDTRTGPSAAPALTFAPVEIAQGQPPPDAGGKIRSPRRSTGTRISGSVAIELRRPLARRRVRGRRSCCAHHLGPEARMIAFPQGVRVWLATGHTDMRRGFPSLALLVQEQLKQDPYSGHLFIFRGRRGGLIKVIWHDGLGACLFSKRLERGRFIWPTPAEGAVTISPAQMGYLLEGIDWRAPQKTWRPELAG